MEEGKEDEEKVEERFQEQKQSKEEEMSASEMRGIDPECINLIDAINRIPGLYTISSCCGHGRHPFTIFFKVDSGLDFPILLYHIDR